MDDILRRVLGEDIVLELRPDPDLGWVKGDRWAVAANYFEPRRECSRRHAPGGRLCIETLGHFRRRWPREAAGFRCVRSLYSIVVRDSGQGMDQETRACIFEPFFTTKELGKGNRSRSGYRYVRHRETKRRYIWAESKLGHGSAYLHVACLALQNLLIQKSCRNVFNFRSGGETILLVEDDSALRKMAVEVLRDTGYKVVIAHRARKR